MSPIASHNCPCSHECYTAASYISLHRTYTSFFMTGHHNIIHITILHIMIILPPDIYIQKTTVAITFWASAAITSLGHDPTSLDLWNFYSVCKFLIVGIPRQVRFLLYVGVQKIIDFWPMSLASTNGASGDEWKNPLWGKYVHNLWQEWTEKSVNGLCKHKCFIKEWDITKNQHL